MWRLAFTGGAIRARKKKNNVCVHVHVHVNAWIRAPPYGSEMCNSRKLDPRCGGDPSRAQKWSQRGLLCIRFWFVPEQEASQGKLLRCVHHQSGNQKWQEHLRVRANSLCARVSVRASLRACTVAPSAVAHCSQA